MLCTLVAGTRLYLMLQGVCCDASGSQMNCSCHPLICDHMSSSYRRSAWRLVHVAMLSWLATRSIRVNSPLQRLTMLPLHAPVNVRDPAGFSQVAYS